VSSIDTDAARRFPHRQTFDTWDNRCHRCQHRPKGSSATLEWIDRHENLAVHGPSGTGKSHLLEALGHAAIGNGADV
jgi:DNA replication protein DnaC